MIPYEGVYTCMYDSMHVLLFTIYGIQRTCVPGYSTPKNCNFLKCIYEYGPDYFVYVCMIVCIYDSMCVL